MENIGIVNIGVEHIHPHPENPRKDLGDLTELAESLKKNGVMQNLTVVPVEGQQGEYYALIGNRRHGAAKLAGLEELPCRIVEDMGRKEQLSAMLEENMQRSDLTIYEQAQGFQLMLDLGETEEQIAEKTGFSKTTIRHRLNIAKLDQKLLKEKENNELFQLTLTDLYALEQVENIKTRDKILREATSSRDLVWKARNAADEAKRDKTASEIIKLLKAAGLEEAPKEAKDQIYSGKWETMESYHLDKAAPKRITKKKVEGGMYLRWYREVRVIKKKDKTKEPVTEYESQKKEKEKRSKAIKAIAKEMAAQREDFVRGILSGKIKPLKDTSSVMDKLWESFVLANGCGGKTSLAKFLANTKKSWYDLEQSEKDKALGELEKTSTLHQMLIGACVAVEGLQYTDWNNHYKQDTGKAVTAITEALGEYGFSYADEEQNKVLDGTHELYTKPEGE